MNVEFAPKFPSDVQSQDANIRANISQIERQIAEISEAHNASMALKKERIKQLKDDPETPQFSPEIAFLTQLIAGQNLEYDRKVVPLNAKIQKLKERLDAPIKIADHPL